MGNQFRTSPNRKLIKDIAKVRLHRLPADLKSLADFYVTQTFNAAQNHQGLATTQIVAPCHMFNSQTKCFVMLKLRDFLWIWRYSRVASTFEYFPRRKNAIE